MGAKKMKDLKISKELIKNVLAEETKNLSEDFSFDIDEDYIVFRDEGETLFDYNIYKFAFKCKEWALTQNYSILSLSTKDGGKCEFYLKSKNSIKDKIKRDKSEVESIIKACSWILENLKLVQTLAAISGN